MVTIARYAQALFGLQEFEYDPARRTIVYYAGNIAGGPPSMSVLEADELSGDWIVLLGSVP